VLILEFILLTSIGKRGLNFYFRGSDFKWFFYKKNHLKSLPLKYNIQAAACRGPENNARIIV